MSTLPRDPKNLCKVKQAIMKGGKIISFSTLELYWQYHIGFRLEFESIGLCLEEPGRKLEEAGRTKESFDLRVQGSGFRV